MTPTERTLLDHPDFSGFCAAWQEDRRVPLPMADWLVDRAGLDQEATERAVQAVWWAWETGERAMLGTFGEEYSRPMPTKGIFTGEWFWYCCGHYPGTNECDVPIPKVSPRGTSFATFPAAIAFYLAHFDEALAAKYQPKCRATEPTGV